MKQLCLLRGNRRQVCWTSGSIFN